MNTSMIGVRTICRVLGLVELGGRGRWMVLLSPEQRGDAYNGGERQ